MSHVAPEPTVQSSLSELSFLRLFFLFSVTFLIFSCSYEFSKNEAKGPTSNVPNSKPNPKPTPTPTPSPSPPPPPPDLSAAVDFQLIKSFAMNACMNCHTGTYKPDLNSIEDIRANFSQALHAIEEQRPERRMPPADQGYAALTECQKDVLKKWAELGFVEKSDVKTSSIKSCGDGSKEPEKKNILDMPVNYQTLTTEILQKKCITCHNPKGDSDAAFNLLYPYSELGPRTGLLGTSSKDSKFLRILSAKGEGRMPPVDADPPVDPLTADELEFVKRWIDLGHPEN